MLAALAGNRGRWPGAGGRDSRPSLYLGGLWLFVDARRSGSSGASGPPRRAPTPWWRSAAALLFGVRGTAVATAVIVDRRAWASRWPTCAGGCPPASPPSTSAALAVFLASLLSLVGMALYATAELRRAIAGLRAEVEERRAIEDAPSRVRGRGSARSSSRPRWGSTSTASRPPDRLVFTGSNPAGDRILGTPGGPPRRPDDRGGLPRPGRHRGPGPLPSPLRRGRLVEDRDHLQRRPLPGHVRGQRVPDRAGDDGGDVPGRLGAGAPSR